MAKLVLRVYDIELGNWKKHELGYEQELLVDNNAGYVIDSKMIPQGDDEVTIYTLQIDGKDGK